MAHLEAGLATSETANQSARPAVVPGLLNILCAVLCISADGRLALGQLALLSRAAVTKTRRRYLLKKSDVAAMAQFDARLAAAETVNEAARTAVVPGLLDELSAVLLICARQRRSWRLPVNEWKLSLGRDKRDSMCFENNVLPVSARARSTFDRLAVVRANNFECHVVRRRFEDKCTAHVDVRSDHDVRPMKCFVSSRGLGICEVNAPTKHPRHTGLQ